MVGMSAPRQPTSPSDPSARPATQGRRGEARAGASFASATTSNAANPSVLRRNAPPSDTTTRGRGTIARAMRRSVRSTALVLVATLAALAPRVARADGRVEFLVDQLRNGEDFRVRTQAALALGAVDDAAAVAPLCDAMDDANEMIRGAAAAALGKLGRNEGLDCLKRHDADASATVRAVVQRSVKTLDAASAKLAAARAPTVAYVALGPTTDRTGRESHDVPTLVREAMLAKLESLGGYAIAPASEAPAAARGVLAKRKLKGFFLQTAVDSPKYDGDRLSVQVRVTMWTYPGKALQGEFAPSAVATGVREGDVDTENRLIRAALERAVDSFSQTVASLP